MCGIAGVVAEGGIGRGGLVEAEIPGDRSEGPLRDLPGDRARPRYEAAPPDLLSHRGPDGARAVRWSAPGCGGLLIHTRLAIVDLSDSGRQPMTDEHGRLLVAFNGEIYNHRELRRLCESRGHRLASRMDGEVIVHLWEDEGPACLRRLNGIFAVAVVDRHSGEVWLARDPLGVKPLFHLEDRRALWFASEPAAIAALGADPGPLDVVALAQFLSFLWIPDPHTPRQRVRSVLPGQLLRWRAGEGIRRSRYGDPLHPVPDPPRTGLAAATAKLAEHLAASCARQTLGDVPVALMASGGVDSSLLWWGGGDELSGAYTIEWPAAAGSERLDEDAATVRALAARARWPVTFLPGDVHEPVRRPLGGDLFADPAYELTRLIADRARTDGRKVLWSGQGGDELLAGYRRHRVARLLADRPAGMLRAARVLARPGVARGPRAEYLTRLARAAGAPGFFERYMHLCTYSDAEERARVLGCSVPEVVDDVVWQRHREVYDAMPAGLSPLRRALTLDLNVYLPGLGLAYVDRAGMEHGVEIRVPWLDLDLVRWSLTLPDDVLAAEGGKGPARALARRVLPRMVADRAKRGFAAPVERLMAGDGRDGARGHRQGRYFAHAAGIVAALSTEGSTA